MRTQFTFYESFYKALSCIKDAETRCAAYDSICSYALTGEFPDFEELPDAVALAFEMARPVLDSAAKKAKNGRSGGSKPKANESKPKANRSKPKANLSKAQANSSKPEANASEKEGEKEKEKEKEKEREIEKERENECYTLSPTPLPREETVLPFETFWSAYPRKQARMDAVKAFGKISEDDRVKILPALEKAKASSEWTRDDGQYIPYPASWLNGHRWEDEVDEKKEMSPLEEDLADLARWAEGG